MRYDLHIHSNVSDGKLSRTEIVNTAIEKQLKYVSFTDHNTFDDSAELKRMYSSQINIINGIEFDVSQGISFHALCYFENYDKKITKLIENYRNNTNQRSDLLIKNINRINGLNLSLEYLMQYFKKDYITKREIIDWLIDNNFAKTVNEASYNFTSKSAPSYVEKYSLNFRLVADAIKSIDGKILIAHPTTLKMAKIPLENYITSLINNGLDGIEIVNSSKMSEQDTSYYQYLAKKFNLLTSGGSDFHNTANGDEIGINDENSFQLIKSLKKDHFNF